jgi:hypothetical protein
MVTKPETLKCPQCGWDSGISSGPLLQYFPDDVKCPNGHIVLFVPKATL